MATAATNSIVSLASARRLVMRHGWNAVSYQILNPGMRLWFSRAGDAVAGYARFGRVWIIAGAPVCAPERLSDVALEIEADAWMHNERVVFFGAGARLERAYAERSDHSLVCIGAQPTWKPSAWPAIVQHKSSLRAQLNRARNKGVRIREWSPARAERAPVLRAVLNEWLATRGLPPLQFLVTPNLFDNLGDRRIFIAERGGDVIGYLIATVIPARRGWLVEQWPRRRSAPNGTTHLLVDAAMRAFGAAGAQYATLGLSPLSDHAGELGAGQPAWLRFALRWIRAHGRRFDNFRGLEAFKASAQPMGWEPIFAIAPGRRITPFTLRAIAGAFSGGSPERLVARALISAAKKELSHARQAAARIARAV
jgi:phosphatidylglycerol lysyltransferase